MGADSMKLDTARLVFLDTLGCGLKALEFPECTKLLGPVVPGTVVPNGVKVPGTPYQLDPISGAFNIGAMIRWLDFNDCWLAAEWGHPSDSLGAILSVTDWINRTNKSGAAKIANGKIFTVKDVLEGMIKAHEVQGCLALENSFNRNGLDHVALVKIASISVISKDTIYITTFPSGLQFYYSVFSLFFFSFSSFLQIKYNGGCGKIF